MIVGDLFSGIGGFSLAAEWMGWQTAFFSEIDPYASAVLKQQWPDVPNLGDITRIDWSTAPRVDVLTGGFPCQPHSLAGKRESSADPRDLWSECVRSLRSLRPSDAVFENVTGIFTSDDGWFFNRMLSDLAALGFDAKWGVLSASDVGAPHIRERVWIHAYTDCERRIWRSRDFRQANRRNESAHAREEISHASSIGREGRSLFGEREQEGHAHPRKATAGIRNGARPSGGAWATESGIRRVVDGVPDRPHRLRTLGNSIVPQCAYEIFRVIEARAVIAA